MRTVHGRGSLQAQRRTSSLRKTGMNTPRDEAADTLSLLQAAIAPRTPHGGVRTRRKKSTRTVFPSRTAGSCLRAASSFPIARYSNRPRERGRQSTISPRIGIGSDGRSADACRGASNVCLRILRRLGTPRSLLVIVLLEILRSSLLYEPVVVDTLDELS